jgi:prophage antirepressor-like protein
VGTIYDDDRLCRILGLHQGSINAAENAVKCHEKAQDEHYSYTLQFGEALRADVQLTPQLMSILTNTNRQN